MPPGRSQSSRSEASLATGSSVKRSFLRSFSTNPSELRRISGRERSRREHTALDQPNQRAPESVPASRAVRSSRRRRAERTERPGTCSAQCLRSLHPSASPISLCALRRPRRNSAKNQGEFLASPANPLAPLPVERPDCGPSTRLLHPPTRPARDPARLREPRGRLSGTHRRGLRPQP